jgi:hypothetical protein
MDVKADVAAVLQQLLDLVLGGIPDDEARKAVNAEYLKLKAGFDKADKLGSTKAKVTAYQALPPAGAGPARQGRGIRYAFGLWDGNGKQLVAPARTAIGKIAARPRPCSRRPLAASRPRRCAPRAPATAPRCSRRCSRSWCACTPSRRQLPKRSKEIDDGIAAAAKVLLALDKNARLRPAGAPREAAGREEERLARRRDLRGGRGSVDGLLAEAASPADRGKELTTNLADEKELEAVSKRLDGLKPRIDRADDAGMPKPVEDRQANVRNFAKVIEEQMAAEEQGRGAEDAGRPDPVARRPGADEGPLPGVPKKFEAARDGPVKKARALKLDARRLRQLARHAAAGARERDRGVHRERRLRAGAAHDRSSDPAGRRLGQGADGLQEPARQVARRRRPRGPRRAAGGDKVLDQLVADLPPTTTPKVLYVALKARYGVDITQYEHMKRRRGRQARLGHRREHEDRPDGPEHRPGGRPRGPLLGARQGAEPGRAVRREDQAGHPGQGRRALRRRRLQRHDRAALRPPRLAADRQDRFQRDQATSCRRANRCSRAASRRPAPPTRPGSTSPCCTRWATRSTTRATSWAASAATTPAGCRTGTGTIAEKIAAKVGYDKKYIEKMLDDKSSTPPKKAPEPPEGTSQADWDKAKGRGRGVGARTSGSARSPGATPPMAKRRTTADGIVYHEGYEGRWVGYKYSARAQGITGYQFRAPAEWFAELYAAYHMQKLNPSHPASKWLAKLKAESQTS